LNLETGGELLVRQLVDDSQLKRFTLAGRESVELTLQRKAGGEALLDFGESVFAGKVERQAKSLASARLDLIPPDSVRQNVAGNPEQPRQRRALVIVAETLEAQESPRERLGGEVAGRPGESSGQPRVHVADVPGVQL
jgi:hypothetical protein